MPPVMDEDEDERRYQAPYSARRPVPTVSKYREGKAARQQESTREDQVEDVATKSEKDLSRDHQQERRETSHSYAHEIDHVSEEQEQEQDQDGPQDGFKDTSEVHDGSTDVKQRRKELKKKKKKKKR